MNLRSVALAGAVLFGAAGTAAAQCGAEGCGPRLSNCCANRGDCGILGLIQYPRSEFRYIKQFCKPTIHPGSCFGHYKTQWTPWPAACPNWGHGDTVYAATEPQNPAMLPPAKPVPETPANPPKFGKVEPIPEVKDPPKVPPIAPPTAPPPKTAGEKDKDKIEIPPVPKIPENPGK